MIKIVNTGISVGHNTKVSQVVDELQKNNYIINSITRVSHQYLLFFGEDITIIEYTKNNNFKNQDEKI